MLEEQTTTWRTSHDAIPEVNTLVKIGEKAPNARVKIIRRPEGTIEDFELKTAYEQGTVVLYFFPLAFTSVCDDSNSQIKEDFNEYQQRDIQFYSCSRDSPFVLKKWAELYDLKHDILSDYNGEAIKAFEVVHEDLLGLKNVAKRSLFVIKNGTISWKWVTDVPKDYPPFEELRTHLNQP